MVGHRRSDRGGTASRYCSQCGSALEGSPNYCQNCGASTDRSAADSRGRTERDAAAARGPRGVGTDAATESDATATERERLEHRITRASREGWELEHDFGDHAVMVRRTFGSVNEHIAVALVTVWFTMGVGNALWGAYRYFGDAERIVLRADSVAADAGVSGERATDDGPSHRWRASAAGYWVVAALVALIGLEVATATASLVLFALAALFATLGASTLPSVRRRLESRHSITANGRVRSVDERTVTVPDGRCAACAGPIGRGIERTFRREFCVLGVPLVAEEGRNYYCRRCATAGTEAVGATGRSGSVHSPEPSEPPDPADRAEPTPDREPEPDRS